MANSSATVPFRPATNTHTGPPDLATIAELEGYRGNSSSPEPYETGVEVNRFGDNVLGVTRRSTHPPVLSISNSQPLTGKSPLGNPKVLSPGRANTYGTSTGGEKSRRHIFHRKRAVDSVPRPGDSRRASTIDTKFSASFEETAVWDQKAILSLGKSWIPTSLCPSSYVLKSIAQMVEVFADTPRY